MRTEDYQIMQALESDYWWFIGMRMVTGAVMARHLRRRPQRILDIGCGTGINLLWMALRHHPDEIVGCDLSPTALELCRRTLTTARPQPSGVSFTLTRGDIRRLPFADCSFDLVSTMEVLDTLGPGEDAAALADIHRVLRPGGLAFVRVPAYQWLLSSHDLVFETRHRYSAGELRGKMEAAGFRILSVTYANTLLFPLAMTQRLLRKWLGIAADRTDTQPWPRWLEWLNTAFRSCLVLEASLLRRGWLLPFGLSAICIGTRWKE